MRSAHRPCIVILFLDTAVAVELGLARSGGVLHVIWNRGTGAASIFDPRPSVLRPSGLQNRNSGMSARIGAPGMYVAYTDRTDAKGHATVALRPGSYSASATAAGYLPASTHLPVR